MNYREGCVANIAGEGRSYGWENAMNYRKCCAANIAGEGCFCE